MKVALLHANGEVFAYTWLSALEIPDAVDWCGSIFQMESGSPLAKRLNCDAVYRKVRVISSPRVNLYTAPVDRRVLRLISTLRTMSRQPRDVALVDDPAIVDTIADAAMIYAEPEKHLTIQNDEALEELKWALVAALRWKHPGQYIFDDTARVWTRGPR